MVLKFNFDFPHISNPINSGLRCNTALVSRIPTLILITSRHVFFRKAKAFFFKLSKFSEETNVKTPRKHLTVPKHAKSQSVFDPV